MSINSNTLLLVDASNYFIYSTESVNVSKHIICPYDRLKLKPSICKVSDHEYLVITTNSSQSALGIFISGTGEPVRSTLEWKSIPRRVTVQYPYIIALFKSEIQIHTIYDLKLIQVLSFESDTRIAHRLTVSLIEKDDTWISNLILSLSDCSLVSVMMQSITHQIDQLFLAKEYQSAIDLLRHSLPTEDRNESGSKVYH